MLEADPENRAGREANSVMLKEWKVEMAPFDTPWRDWTCRKRPCANQTHFDHSYFEDHSGDIVNDGGDIPYLEDFPY